MTPGPEFWALLPLALAAGLDLYLTLFFLGTAAYLGWEAAAPGALSGLESAPVLVLAAVFYALEAFAERYPPAALFWNAAHVLVRPVTGGLMALLLLHHAPIGWRVAGFVAAAVVTLGAHAVRVGGAFVLWLSGARKLTRVLAAAGEDAMVLALCVLVLDHPAAGALLATLMIVTSLPRARPYLDAFLFGLRAAWGRTWGALRTRRWLDRDDFPDWVAAALDDDPAVPGGPLRGSPAAAFRLPGAGLFRRGWLVVTGVGPRFVYRPGLHSVATALPPARAVDAVQEVFHRRIVFVDAKGRSGQLHVPFDGPSLEGLRAEFEV